MQPIHAILPLLLVAAAAAQVKTSEGPLAGAPMAFSLQAGGSIGGDQLLFKLPGFDATKTPPRWTPIAGRPEFSATKILYDAQRGCTTTATSTLDIDAISVGLDLILADATGKVLVPAGRWGALMLSVGTTTAGAPGSVIAQEAARADSKAGTGADVFTYTLQGSNLPGAWVDVTQRALDRTEIFLKPGDVIDAIDMHLPQFALDSLAYAKIPAYANPPTFYFSLSSATANRATSTWWGGTSPSGATILHTDWNPRTMQWSCPRVFLSYRQLGLQATDDLTALAVDESRGFILFSTLPSANRPDPILFYNYGAGGSVQVYRYPSSNDDELPVSTGAGLVRTDSVVAVCAIDPALGRQTGGAGGAAVYAFGSPLPEMYCNPPLPFQRSLSASIFRSVTGGVPTLDAWVLGWPAVGAGPGSVAALIWLYDASAPPCVPYPAATLLFAAGYPRNPANPLCGDPLRLSVPLPPGLPAPPLTAVLFQWLALQSGGTFNDIVTAFPVAISLP